MHNRARKGGTEGTRGATTTQGEHKCSVAGTEGTWAGGATGTANAAGTAKGTASAVNAIGTAEDKEGLAATTCVCCRQARPGVKSTADSATTSASRGAGPAQYSGVRPRTTH